MFNKLKTHSARLSAGSLCLLLYCFSFAAYASPITPVEGERLSDWLLRQPNTALSYSTGLQWQVPAERETQAKLKRNLLAELNASTHVPAPVRANLIKLLEALPVTGRVPLSMPDARWLQAHPKQDPVLMADHRIVLPSRPSTVSVLMQSGIFCTVSHRPGAQVINYLQACEPTQFVHTQRAFVVQPDGALFNYGVAAWNQEAQAELAPGAGARMGPRLRDLA